MSHTLAELTAKINVIARNGRADATILDLCYDSRQAKAGSLFFALPGLHADGNAFIADAVARGAVAVIHQGDPSAYLPDVAYVKVNDARAVMAPVSAAFYGQPADSLKVIGVTGTEGKSTTVYLVWQLLTLMGRKAGFLSTVAADYGQGEIPNPEHQTTPEAPAVQKALSLMRDSGCEFAVIECSSHGLSDKLNRLGEISFDAALMTNVTLEHLEFHGSLERYRDDKANLFRRCRGFGLVNALDPNAASFISATDRPVHGVAVPYGQKPVAGLASLISADELKADARGNDFIVVEECAGYRCRVELPGAFNVFNSLMALRAVSLLLDIPPSRIAPRLGELVPVRGRMTVIDRGQDFEVVVDYAHTPSSFEAIMPSIRARADEKGSRVICLFGSGGERDRVKRPLQGEIAAKYCDLLVLSDEDPRGEEPAALLSEIAAGCPGAANDGRVSIIPDRAKGIRFALSKARPGDIVLLLGKGHENSIIYKTGKIDWDEIAEASKALAELGYPGKEKA